MQGDVNLRSPLLPAAAVASLAPAANLPRRPATRFWGRQSALAAVVRRLDEPEPRLIGSAVVGMAGVGKTELVLQAIDARRARFPLVWWVTGADAEAVQFGLASLAHHLHPDTRQWRSAADGAEWAMDWLQSHDGWLLVLDNVEARSDVAAVLARIGRGPVLLTSRWNLDWSRCGLAVSPLGVLARADSVRFLLDGTGSTTDTEGAERLAADLGDLPIALQQASAYVREQDMSFDDYRDLLAAEPDVLLDSPAWADVHRDNTSRTLRLSIAKVAETRPSAERLLRVTCCFAPDRVPRRLLTARHPEPADHRSDVALLHSYSLVNPHDRRLSVHRLLRQLVRDSMAVGAEEVSWAAVLLGRARPDDPFNGVPDWPLWVELIPHAEALAAIVASVGTRRSVIDLADSVHEIGTFMLAQGWNGQSVRFLDRAARDRAERLGPDDAATLDSWHRLGESLRGLGQLTQALDLHEATLAARLRRFGAADRRTLQTRETLAITYKALGRTNEAIQQHEAVLRDRIAALGETDLDVLWSMHNLALAYKQIGRLDEALALLQRVYAERTRVLGPDHPDTLRCPHNIANIHHDAGRHAEAIAVQQRNVSDRVRVLGAEHRDTLRSQSNLADTYLAAGRVADALALHRHTLDQREKALGTDNADTRWSRERVRIALGRAGGSHDASTPPP
ncbi:FxSxx-COOH system tetratricopeptide repeat protein [Solwaraspora sp. WMMB335]|uniref:FxSxx-COOH system tetratricopeptide repeat protein n=1 Tax=Solwaraspora sp. WMMB335 TaxID=3404118 RepID=UPI003B944322